MTRLQSSQSPVMPPPVSSSLMRRIRRKMTRAFHGEAPADFHSSPTYWEGRYENGSNSGPGSYGRLAVFKANVINQFVKNRNVRSVIEFGCGDGAQLTLADYPEYTGIDVSPSATALCRRHFADDPHKKFITLDDPASQDARGEMALSLDVIYHLVEDDVYDAYMRRLVQAAARFIFIYSSNVELPGHVPHIRHRCFMAWLAKNAPEWALSAHVCNEYPYDINNPTETSWADFYFFERGDGGESTAFAISPGKEGA
jgi:hypothetical protein